MGAAEWFSLTVERNRSAVDLSIKRGLNVNVGIVRQTGDKGYPDIHIPQLVRRVFQAVKEVDTSVKDLYIVKGKPGRLIFFLRLGCQKVRKVIGTVFVTHYVHIRLIHFNLTEYQTPF